MDEYDQLAEEFGIVTMDATQPIHDQQQKVRELVEPLLPGVMRKRGQDVTDVLSSTGLTGRYITKSGSRRMSDLQPPTDG